MTLKGLLKKKNIYMELYDPEFVHFMWDDSLKGKEGFFAQDIDFLIDSVNINNTKNKNRVYQVKDGDSSFPFSFGKSITTSNHFRFFYYDPNYECKVALAKGCQIQFLSRQQGSDGSRSEIWYDCVPAAGEPKWIPGTKYRIKPAESTMMTYRELAEWLAKGNGQCLDENGKITTFLDYNEKFDDSRDCGKHLIRRWDSNKWINPTRDIYMKDCGYEDDETIKDDK